MKVDFNFVIVALLILNLGLMLAIIWFATRKVKVDLSNLPGKVEYDIIKDALVTISENQTELYRVFTEAKSKPQPVVMAKEQTASQKEVSLFDALSEIVTTTPEPSVVNGNGHSPKPEAAKKEWSAEERKAFGERMKAASKAAREAKKNAQQEQPDAAN